MSVSRAGLAISVLLLTAASSFGKDSQVAEAIVAAPPAVVWKAFSTADGYKKLGVSHCDLDFRVGGVIRSHYDPKGVLGDEGTIHNEILSYEPQRMLSIRIKQPPKGFPFGEETYRATWSVIWLSDLGDGRTHVRIVGLGYAESEEGQKMRQFFESGNAWVLAKLKKEYDAQSAGPSGPAHATSPLAPLSFERTIELPRGEAWELIATAAGWKKFLGAEATIELRPGGRFEVQFDPRAPEGQRGSEGCKVLSVVPQQLLSFDWNAPPKFAHARQQRTWVAIRLEELGPTRTRLRLDHLGFAEQAVEHPESQAEWKEVRAYLQSAWTKVLDAVQAKEARLPVETTKRE